MKILVVHDRNTVAERIKAIITEAGHSDSQIDIAGSSVEAKALLQHNQYDLAFIDLTIPIRDAGSANDYGVAEQLLQEIFWSDLGVTPGDIVGITKDAEAIPRINSAIGPHLMAIIEERPDCVWETNVIDKVNYIARSRRSKLRSISAVYDVDVLILTALDEELEPFHDDLDLVPCADFRGAFDFTFTCRDGRVRRGVAFSIGWAGQPSCASATEALISRFRPKLAIMSGICGGYESEAKLGEVLIFQTVWDWDSGKWSALPTGPLFLSRPEPLSIRGKPAHDAARILIADGLALGAPVLVKAKEVQPLIDEVRINFGSVASGSAVVANTSVGTAIRQHSDNISAIDMESYGFYYAASNTRCVQPDYICIKSVCDFADEKKDDRFHKVASYLAAQTTLDLILFKWTFA